MDTIQIVLGIALLVMAVFLVIAVLMQSGSSKKLSGSIAGGAETFFGKNKGKTLDKMFSKLTNVVSILFVIVVLVTYYYAAASEGKKDESGNKSEQVSVDVNTSKDVTTSSVEPGSSADESTTTSSVESSVDESSTDSSADSSASSADSGESSADGSSAEQTSLDASSQE